MKVFLLKWLISWCTFIQGIIGIFTFGYVMPKLELWAAKKYSRAKWVKKYGNDAYMEVNKWQM